MKATIISVIEDICINLYLKKNSLKSIGNNNNSYLLSPRDSGNNIYCCINDVNGVLVNKINKKNNISITNEPNKLIKYFLD